MDLLLEQAEFEIHPIPTASPCFSAGSWELWDEERATWHVTRCGPLWDILASREPLTGELLHQLSLGIAWAKIDFVEHKGK